MPDSEDIEWVGVDLDVPRIPQGSVPTASICIVGFIAPDGSYGYAIKQGGSAYLTEYLGLLGLAEHEFMRPGPSE